MRTFQCSAEQKKAKTSVCRPPTLWSVESDDNRPTFGFHHQTKEGPFHPGRAHTLKKMK